MGGCDGLCSGVPTEAVQRKAEEMCPVLTGAEGRRGQRGVEGSYP